MYKYPDEDDRLTCALIHKEFDGIYWSKSEESLFDNIRTSLYDGNKLINMLDVGAGTGRMFSFFANDVYHITALEPDKKRYEDAAQRAKLYGEKVRVIHGDAAYLESGEKFDIVLVSHILQHISDEKIYELLSKISEVTIEGSRVILTTTHINGDTDRFFSESWEGEKRVSKEIDKSRFEAVFKSEGVLPVRMFAEKTVLELMSNAGFNVIEKKYYHYENHHDISEDKAANDAGDDRGARDIFFIFEKAGEVTVDANVSYQFSFSYFKEDSVDKIEIDMNTIKDSIKKAFPDIIFENDEEAKDISFFKEIKMSKDFLHGGGLPFKEYRFYFPSYKLEDSDIEIAHTTVHMTVFPEASIAQINVSLRVVDCDTEELVYLRHVQGNGRKFRNKDGKNISVKEIFSQIAGSLERNITDMEETYLVEINRMGENAFCQEVFKKYPRELYAVMCGDEGYSNVPLEITAERLSNSWGSREFVRLCSFGANNLFVNLNETEVFRNYVKNRRSFDAKYYGEINPYFLIKSNVAGINHGVLFSQELVMVIKTISSRILSRQSSYNMTSGGSIRDDIRRTRKYRSELITTLRKVESLSISEIGEMEKVLLSGQNIEPIIEKIKYLLELLESELDLLYQSSTNRLINILTIAGLIISATALALQFLATF